MSGYSSYSTPKKFMRLAPGTPPPLRSNNWDSMSYDSVLKKFYQVSNVLSLFYNQNQILARFMTRRRRSKVPKFCFFQINFCQGFQQIEKWQKKKTFPVLQLGLTSALFPPLKSFALILLFGLFISFTLSYFVICFFFLFFTSFINSFSFYFIHSVLVLSRTWNIEDLCLAF